MNADDIIKQGREIADQLRREAGEQVAQHEQTIKDTIGKAVAFVNEKTEGRYTEQVGKVAGYVEQGVDWVASERRDPEPRPDNDPEQPSSGTGVSG